MMMGDIIFWVLSISGLALMLIIEIIDRRKRNEEL